MDRHPRHLSTALAAAAIALTVTACGGRLSPAGTAAAATTPPLPSATTAAADATAQPAPTPVPTPARTPAQTPAPTPAATASPTPASATASAPTASDLLHELSSAGADLTAIDQALASDASAATSEGSDR